MNIGFVGSRDYKNYDFGQAVLKAALPHMTTLVSGGARGPDTWGERFALSNGIPVCIHKPRGQFNSKYEFAVAAKDRNTRIAEDSDVIIALYDRKSKGTLDTINKANSLNKSVYVFDDDGIPYMTLNPHRYEDLEIDLWLVC